MLYTTPIENRLGFMAELVNQARFGNVTLRHILTNKHLLSAGMDQPKLFHRHCPGTYLTIAQAANKYCLKFWGSSVRDVVFCRVEEPPTGEVLEESVVTIII